MAPATKEAPAKPAEEKPKAVVIPEITSTDDKRAQYARLVVFNHGVKSKIIGKDQSVNEVKAAEFKAAFKDLVGGTYLHGKEGLEYIQAMTKAGSTTGNPLTTAYASEVRPFLRQGKVADTFGRRGGLTEEEKAKREAEAKAAKDEREKAKAEKKAIADAEKAEKAELKAKAKAEADAAKAKAAAEAAKEADAATS